MADPVADVKCTLNECEILSSQDVAPVALATMAIGDVAVMISGKFYLINHGSAVTSGDTFSGLLAVPVLEVKTAAVVIVAGETLYFDETAKVFTNAAPTLGAECGTALEAAISEAGVKMRFYGLAASSDVINTDQTIQSTVGAANAEIAIRLGATATEGLEIRVIDEIVTLTNAVEDDLTETIPAGAVILSGQMNLNTAVVGDGTGDAGLVKVGLGTTANPDLVGKTAALTLNAKSDFIPDWAVLAAETTITVKAADTNGAAVTEKFVGGELVRVRLVYAMTNSLDDA